MVGAALLNLKKHPFNNDNVSLHHVRVLSVSASSYGDPVESLRTTALAQKKRSFSIVKSYESSQNITSDGLDWTSTCHFLLSQSNFERVI